MVLRLSQNTAVWLTSGKGTLHEQQLRFYPTSVI